MDAIEDSYYLRRKNSFYVHLLKDGTRQEEVKFLFSSDFHAKVLNVVALTRSDSSKDSFLIWTKPPCESLAPKLTNIWTKSSGFREGCFTFVYSTTVVLKCFAFKVYIVTQ